MTTMIYLDHSATTPSDPRVVEKMLPYWTTHFGNPSSLHTIGKTAANAVDEAREIVASVLNSDPSEIIFTSGGTESNNLALRGIMRGVQQRKGHGHLIVTGAEHHAVLDVAKVLELEGHRLTILPTNEYGQVSPQAVLNALQDDTFLVSAIYANNEVGSINPITDIGKILREKRIYFHVDAVQGAGLLPLDVKALNVDALSLSGHKFYGSKGAGLLYVRRGVPLKGQIVGGGQQNHRRSGTEAVPLMVGIGEALRLAENERESTVARLTTLRDQLIHDMLTMLPEAELTGHPTERLAGHASFTLDGINGDAVLLDLNEVGIAASGGSACTSGDQEPSHVLRAMNVHPDRLVGQVRFVLGKHTTPDEIETFLQHLSSIVERHRRMKPMLVSG